MKTKRMVVVVLINAFSIVTYANSPTLSFIVKQKMMNQYDALAACPAGTHVPSARELAQRAVTLGAKGIIETGPVSLPGYRFVAARNMDGSYDAFYFNSEGYQPPVEERKLRYVWTSSINHNLKEAYYNGDGLYLDNSLSESGFGSVKRDSDYAQVVCFPGEAIQPKDMILKEAWSMPRHLESEGFTFCPLGTHMPSAREFAQIAMKYGAKGILEMDQVDPNNIPKGYSQIGGTLNYSCGVQKPFYFNGEGIQPPSEWKDLFFWTYNCHKGLTYPYTYGHYRFSVMNGVGSISPEYFSEGIHTLCLVGRPQ